MSSTLTAAPERGAIHFEADNEHYHSLPGVSNSRLNDFVDDPALYHGRYVADPPLYPRVEATPDMIFGTNCHSVIQAGSVESVFTIIPRDVLNSDGHKKGFAWKQFAEENGHKTLVKADEVEVYRRILANVKAHNRAASILYGDDGHNEFNIRWTVQETGLLCRARLDRVRPSVLIGDIKTTNTVDPRRFSSAIFSWGYHRQAAFYSEAWRQLTGDELPFVFIAVRKTPPYSVACYTLDEAYLERGRSEVRSALTQLAECYASGVWTRPAEVIELAEPGYARFQDQWELTNE
jgi:hypothetical protein